MPFTEQMTNLWAKTLDRQIPKQLADWLAVAVAVSLPWSTSASAILIALWLVALLPILDFATVRRELATAAGGLPVLLWALAAVGMLWADVTWSERFAGLGGFNRLLVIPLLLAQFRHSEHGAFVLYGFLASATCLLITSWAFALIPALGVHGKLGYNGKPYGVPVKDYISQSGIFLICALALIGAACEYWRKRETRIIAVLVALAACFFANIGFVVTSRTTLVVTPFLILALGWRHFGSKGILAACLVVVVLGGALWLTPSFVRDRTLQTFTDMQAYLNVNEGSSLGLHLEFLRKSLLFIKAAPVIGHGTGTIPEQFRNAAVGQTGVSAAGSANPHNQIFTVAIQLGLVGAGVLLAMWSAHLMLFRGGGLTAWIGMIIVLENVVSSLFNSHLFDFTQGWLYVFGVGTAGGMVLRLRDGASDVRPVAKS
jgi:O-antigen ligase